MKKEYNFATHEDFSRNLVFIDGLTRAGKSILSRLITSFEHMEHIQFFNIIEYVIPAIKFKGLSEEYARSLLRLTLNELYYNLQLSRNVNFRPFDQTGIENYRDPNLYRQRLASKEGDSIFNDLLERDIFVPFQTHELMTDLDIIERLDLDYRFVEIYRNPFDVIHSWIRRGWGDRFFGTDSHPKGDLSSFTLSLSNEDIFIPWYCADYDIGQFMKLNENERASIMVRDLIIKSIDKQKKSKEPERILTLSFEALLQNTDQELQKISNFLDLSLDKKSAKSFLEAEGLPKIYSSQDHEKKKNEIQKSINQEIFNDIENLESTYKDNLYGLI